MELDSRRNPNTGKETKENFLEEENFESGEVFSHQIRKGQEVSFQRLLCYKPRLGAFLIPWSTAQRKSLYEEMKIYLVGCKVKARPGSGIKRREEIIKTQTEDGPAPVTLSGQLLLTQYSSNKGASHKHIVSTCCLPALCQRLGYKQ